MYKPYNGMSFDFSRGQVHVEGIMPFQVMLDNQPCIKIVEVDFFIISAVNNAYNAILGRPLLNKIRAIVLTPHLLMKLPISEGIG